VSETNDRNGINKTRKRGGINFLGEKMALIYQIFTKIIHYGKCPRMTG